MQHQRSTVSELKLRGRGRGLAVTGVTVVLGALVLAGLPPFVSSDGHALLVSAADQAGLPWLEIVVALTVMLSSGAVLRPRGRIWLGWGVVESPSSAVGTADDSGDEAEDRPDTTEAFAAWRNRPDRLSRFFFGRVPLTMALPPLALLAIGLGLGLAPGLEAHAAAAAASCFSDRSVYAAQLLGTHGSTAVAGGAVVAAASGAVTWGGVLTELGQVAVALCCGRRRS